MGSSGRQQHPWWPPLPPPLPPADMGTLEITRGRQALELRSNLSERRALTDPIRPPGRDESSARNLQWAKAHGESRGAVAPPRAGWGDSAEWQGEVVGSTCWVSPSLEKRNRQHRATSPVAGASWQRPRSGVTPAVTSPVGAAPAPSTCRSQPCALCPLPSPAGEPAPPL